jgi:DNA-binding transcriptional LysR family regulator
MYDWAEFRHFLYLLNILEKGGFRIAAEELHTSQPNLTVQARRFQEQASVRLFRKLKNGQIYPTDTGIAFVTLARLVLEIREEVIDALKAIEDAQNSAVRFGSTPLVDPQLFRTFRALHTQLLPRITVRATHGDAMQLVNEVLDGVVDAAFITLPLAHCDLHVEEVRRDRLVVCLRKDHPLAVKSMLRACDLQDNLTIIYHPQRHPEAHVRLLEMLADAGVALKDYSCASHPSEMQSLVNEGYGLALIREGTPLEEGLITRRLSGADWTIDTAVVYHKQRYQKTLPVLVRMLKRSFQKEIKSNPILPTSQSSTGAVKHPVKAVIGTQNELLLRDNLPAFMPTRKGLTAKINSLDR